MMQRKTTEEYIETIYVLQNRDGYKKLEDYTEDLAATRVATTLGLEFDPNKVWDQRKQQYKMSSQIVRTQSIAQTAEGDKNGLWTTVIAVAIFNET
jgi:arginine decarboxylase